MTRTYTWYTEAELISIFKRYNMLDSEMTAKKALKMLDLNAEN